MFKLHVLMIAFIIVGCSDAQFSRELLRDVGQGTGNKNPDGTPIVDPFTPFDPQGNPIPGYIGDQKPPVGITRGDNGTVTYDLKCKIPPALQTLNGPRSTGIQFRGEVCPVATNELVVMFVNDESGSMRDADPSFLGGLFGCGRYSAAKELMNYIASVKSDSDRIFVGLVTFGTGAVIRTGLVPFDTFRQTHLRASNFCDYKNGDAAATDYDEAFVLTQQVLAQKPSTGLSATASEAVFLISDGMPTASRTVPFSDTHPVGSDGFNAPQRDGLNSSRLLSPYAKLSALYLDRPQPGRSNGDPRTYLNALTKDPNRVAIASNAKDLASKMAELALPGLAIVPGSIRITQTAAMSTYHFASMPGDYTFQPDAIRKNVYQFQTKYVLPMVNGSSTTDNVFKIELQAKHPDGRIETISSQLTVRFTPTN